jgi:hypothetical protein
VIGRGGRRGVKTLRPVNVPPGKATMLDNKLTPTWRNWEARDEIARMIVAEPPSWLMDTLSAVLLRVRREIKGYQRYPSRAVLRPKINETADAIEALTRNLLDRGVVSQIAANSPSGTVSLARVNRFLEVVVNDAPHILAALNKAKDNVKAGRGGACAKLNPKAPKPAAVCAAFVVMAWEEIHGKGPNNSKALWAPCAALWLAAGGSRLDRAEASGWKNHIRAVADIPPELKERFRKMFRDARYRAEAEAKQWQGMGLI